MAFVWPKARVLESSATSGNGPYALLGAVDTSYDAFSAFMSVGDTTFGTVVEPGVAFKSGLLTYSATNQITVTTTYASKGTFGAGSKEVFMGLPAARLFETGMHGADIASAATVNLEAATGDLIDIAGTTTITAITLNDGHTRMVRFTGSLTLTHGVPLILPAAANIKTAAGDYAIFRGYASGVVRLVHYSRFQRHGTDVASASTINLNDATGDIVDVTGTTTINAVTLADGREATVRFTGVATLIHSTSLVLPGITDIVTEVGDIAVFRGYFAGATPNVRCVNYQRFLMPPTPTGAWPTYAPTMTAMGGNLGTTSATALAQYKKVDKRLFIQLQLTISAVGALTTGVAFSFPPDITGTTDLQALSFFDATNPHIQGVGLYSQAIGFAMFPQSATFLAHTYVIGGVIQVV